MPHVGLSLVGMVSAGDAEQAQAAVLVERVTIQNFKGILRLEVDLQPGLSLLVGRNNAGKSRILRALHVALGGIPVERDDLTVGSKDPAQIDVFVAPRAGSHTRDSGRANGDDDGPMLDDTFDVRLQRIFGPALVLVSESPERQRFCWRTTITSTSEGSGARSQMESLTYDPAAEEWLPTGQPVGRPVRDLLYAELVDTRRDLDAELRQRGTAIRRILNDLRVPEEEREDLEQRLAALGDDILSHSDTLQNVRGTLDSLDHYVGALGAARIDPVPRTLEELARSVGVSFAGGDEQLASRLHGSGVRSLASLLVQDVFYRRTLGVDGGEVRPHPVTLIEEPEAHLHPHAVFEVARLLEQGGRQVIATTHSPLLATSVTPASLLLVRHALDGGHDIVGFGPAEHDEEDDLRTKKPSFYATEMEKLTRLVERPFGELLFASAIVIGDGATERSFLPPVLREALGALAHGVSVIDSAGMNNQVVRAVIKFARHVDVPLVVFADGDEAGRTRIGRLVDESGLDESREVIWVTDSGSAPSSQAGEPSMALERMLIRTAMDVCVAACEAFGETPNGEVEVLGAMKRLKGSIGAALATEFVGARPYAGAEPWPEPLRALVDLIGQHLAPPVQDR